MKEVDAANILLGQSGKAEQFTIRWHGLNLRLQIRPITAMVLIKISREVAAIPEIEADKPMFLAQLESAKHLRSICRAIAIATKSRFQGIVTSAILELPIADIHKLWNIIINQSDPQSFFFIMVSARGMSQMIATKKARPKAVKPSSDG